MLGLFQTILAQPTTICKNFGETYFDSTRCSKKNPNSHVLQMK